MAIFATQLSVAQPPCQNPEDPDCGESDPPTQVPIDGGIIYLLAAGGIYSIKKIRDNGRKR